MAELDEFESIFKSASKELYRRTELSVRQVLVVTDLGEEESQLFLRDVKEWLAPVLGEVEYTPAAGAAYQDAGELLECIERSRADLVVSYRNLKSQAKRYPFSLGALVDVLTQATTTPVLLVPDPSDGRLGKGTERLSRVMLLTDHLTGSARLIDWAVRFTEPEGKLTLVHLEDDVVFQHYMAVISKVPSLDTEVAERDIRAQLLKEPDDYATSVEQRLAQESLHITVDREVTMGHKVADVKRMARERRATLLVLNTKDDDQLAMHGLAYPLAVELRQLPLLLV